MVTKMKKLREINQMLNTIIMNLETRIFVEKSIDSKKNEKNKLKTIKSSVYK